MDSDNFVLHHNVYQEIMMSDWKKITTQELEETFSKFHFKTKPFHHQLVCLAVGLTYDAYMFALAMGGGKTKVILDLISIRKQMGEPIKALVVCPCQVRQQWVRQAEIHSDLTARAITSGDRLEQLLNPTTDITTINFEALAVACKEVYKTRNGREKVRAPLELLENCPYNMLVIDEAHKVGNVKTNTYGILSSLATVIKYRLLLTGSPIGNNPLQIWGQFHIIDLENKVFGDHWSFLNRAGFRTPFNSFVCTKRGKEYIARNFEKLAIRYREDEFTDLPEKNYNVHNLELDKYSAELYQKTIAKLDGLDFTNPDQETKSQFMKNLVELRRICGGVPTGTTPDDKCPKIELMLDILDGTDDKVVIFHELIDEGRLIEKVLTTHKISWVSCRGETKNKDETIMKFKTDPKVRVLIAHPKSAGTGTDITEANRMIFYSNGYSVTERSQCEKRIHRTGQKLPVFYHDLVMSETIDNDIFDSLKEGKDVVLSIVDPELMRRLKRETKP